MEPAKEIKKHPVDVDGLDEVFEHDSSLIEELQDPDINLGGGLNIKQAAKHYNLSVASIRLKIKLGEVPAVKVSGPKGPEWRVFPEGIPDDYQHDINTVDGVYYQPTNSVPTPSDYVDSTVVESIPNDIGLLTAFREATNNLNKVLEIHGQLLGKVEALTYKNGWLESQLQEKEVELKLLPDLQAQAAKAQKLQEEFEHKVGQVEALEAELKMLNNDRTERTEELETLKLASSEREKLIQEQMDALQIQLGKLQKPWWKKWFLPRDAD